MKNWMSIASMVWRWWICKCHFFVSYEEAWASGNMRRMKDKNEYVFLKSNFHFISAKTHKHVPLSITWQKHDIAKVIHNLIHSTRNILELWWWVMTIIGINFKPFFKSEKKIAFSGWHSSCCMFVFIFILLVNDGLVKSMDI